MYVVVAVRAQSVTDRNPPGRGLSAVLGEVHFLHEVVRDGTPTLVAELAFFCGQTQRAVEDVSAIDFGFEKLLGPVKCVGNIQSSIAVQLVVIVPSHERRIARNEVRFFVLVCRPGPAK